MFRHWSDGMWHVFAKECAYHKENSPKSLEFLTSLILVDLRMANVIPPLLFL